MKSRIVLCCAFTALWLVLSQTASGASAANVDPNEATSVRSDESADELFRVQELRARVKKDAAALLSVVKSLGGGVPSATVTQYLRATKERIDANIAAAEKIIYDARAQSLSRGQAELSGQEDEFDAEAKTLRRFRALTDQYLEKYAPAALGAPAETVVGGDRVARGANARTRIRAKPSAPKFDGNVRLQFGTSSFSGATDASQTAQNIGLTGRYLLSPTSSISLNLDRNSSVKQTAFTSTRGRVGYQAKANSGAQIDAFLGFAAYEDDVLIRSEHSDFNAGGSVNYPIGPTAALIADGGFNSRSYKIDGGNDFSGAQLNGKIRFGSGTSALDLGVRSRFQTSDVSFLNYSRLAPHLDYRKGKGRNYFGAKAEYELFTYQADAETNNYSKVRGDLFWNRGANRSELGVVSKTYANNAALSNIRLRAAAAKRSGARSARHSAVFVYHTNGSEAISNYVDLRSDISSNRATVFFESHLFGRGWVSNNRSHRIDWSGALGWRIWKFKIGPSGGIRMLVDPDGFEFKSDGNSWRFGGKLIGNFAVSIATVSVGARYEYTTAYNSQITIDRTTGLVTRGDVETRNPTALQIAGSLRVPVTQDLDLKVDVRQYDTRLDLNSMLSIGSVENRSQTQILAGLVYRISR